MPTSKTSANVLIDIWNYCFSNYLLKHVLFHSTSFLNVYGLQMHNVLRGITRGINSAFFTTHSDLTVTFGEMDHSGTCLRIVNCCFRFLAVVVDGFRSP